MKVACVLLTHFEGKVETRRYPHLKDSPVVIVDRTASSGRPLVVDQFPAASGVVEGMTIEQAMSRHANVVVLEADEPHYRQVFRQVLGSLQGVSDRVEAAEFGTAYVRVDGLEALYRGEAGVVSTLLNAVPSYLNPRVGVAEAKFPAFVAARVCRPLGAFRVPEDVRDFLAPHSIDLLPISDGVKSGMHRFGLHTMEAVASMSADMITDQFGPEGRWAWALCNGMDDRPVVPMPFDESVVEHISLPFHSSSIEVLFVAVDSLLQRAYARPELRHRYARTAVLRCTAPGWQPWEKRVEFREPVGAWERASSVFRSRLESDPPDIPVDDVTLTLSGFTGESGTQIGLLTDARDDRHRHLIQVERALRGRMNGIHSLHRVVEVAPWHPAPEMRAVQVPIDPSGRDAIKPLYPPMPVQVREGAEREPASILMDRRWRQVARVEDRLDVRPVVAPKTSDPYLLPGRCRWQAGHPVPRPNGRPLVQAERLMKFDYVELHAKSYFSFGIGASHVHELLAQAKEYGYPALALTDTNLCGALEFARLANSLDIQPITGGEITLTDGSRLTLLAKTREGYSNISRLFTLANAVDRREPRLDPSHLSDHSEGMSSCSLVDAMGSSLDWL